MSRKMSRKTYTVRTERRYCALLHGGLDGPVVAGGDQFGGPPGIAVMIYRGCSPDTNPVLGISLAFPLALGNEDAGFGAFYTVDRKICTVGTPVAGDAYNIRLVLPRGQWGFTFREAP